MLATRKLLKGLLVLGWLAVAGQVQASEELVERGRYLFNAAGCVSCHTRTQPLAGGRAIETPFGTFYGPNISPDRQHGIGAWSEEDFMRALGEGVSPRGEHYYPAFPYSSYTRMTRGDMQALWAYLKSQPAYPVPDRPHDLPWYLKSRALLGAWKPGRFTPGVFSGNPEQSREWNRGAYLATALGHCGECHTPRDPFGGPRTSHFMAGTRRGPEEARVPNITRDRGTGLGQWSEQDLQAFFATGRRPEGDYTGSLMAEVLGTGIMHLSEYDRHALAVYLRSLPPIHHDVYFEFDPFEDKGFFE